MNAEANRTPSPTAARCPTCGARLPRKPVGRPRLKVTVQNVKDALQGGRTVAQAAEYLGISRASIYRLRTG